MKRCNPLPQRPANRRPAPAAQAGNPLATVLWGIAAALEVVIVVLGILLLVQYRQQMANYTPRQRGEVYLRQENYRQAQSCFAQALREDGSDPDLYLLHGLASAQVQDNGALRGDVTALEELWPDRKPLLEQWQKTLQDGVLLARTGADGDTTRYLYDLLGRCIEEEITTGGETHRIRCTYGSDGRMSGRIWYQDAGGKRELCRESYTYNAEGWLTRVSYIGADGSDQGTLSLLYNTDGNLTRIRGTGEDFDGTLTFAYDAGGNCTTCSRTGTLPGMLQQMPAAERTYTYQSGASGCGFRYDPREGLVEPRFVTGVTSQVGQGTDSWTCTVDADGRCLSCTGGDEDIRYDYDEQGRLLTENHLSDSGSRTVEYTYGSLAEALAE